MEKIVSFNLITQQIGIIDRTKIRLTLRGKILYTIMFRRKYYLKSRFDATFYAVIKRYFIKKKRVVPVHVP